MLTKRNIQVLGYSKLTASQIQDFNEIGVLQIPATEFMFGEQKTNPLEGFSFRPNFPYCCNNHKKLLHNLLNHFAKFPDCCEGHKRLKTANWFHKSEYFYVPIKVLITGAYTEHCIGECIDKPDWYKRITDYVTYTSQSFGQFPEGYGAPAGVGAYIGYVRNVIEQSAMVSDKKKRLMEFLDAPKSECSEQSDLMLLLKIYNEWLSIFPFELSIFRHLKDILTKRKPFIKGKPETNIYTKHTGFKLISCDELFQFLTDATKIILTEINSLNLYKTDQLTDPDSLDIEMSVAKRELSLKKLKTELSQGSVSYREIISEWLNEEKEFLKDIMPEFKRHEESRPFIEHLTDVVLELQNDDIRAFCIRNLREDGGRKEESFREHFATFLRGRFKDSIVTVEEGKGDGHIDLKLRHKIIGEKVIEFKGWWNDDKKTIAEQICSYLTDRNADGYIIMINHNKKKTIVEGYKDLITTEAMAYSAGTWTEHSVTGTQLKYYISQHRFGLKDKTLYHIILDVYSSI